jgi:acyl carrier protein
LSQSLTKGKFRMSDRLIGVFAEGLQLDAADLTDETSPQNTTQWDSLAAMMLVTLIEDTFEVRLSTRDIMRMNSIGAARTVLQAKGVAGI